MANAVAPYNEIWYSQRAIERLLAFLTFIPTLFRGYEEAAHQKGDTITVRKPGSFTAQNMPYTRDTQSDMNPDSFNIVLGSWKGVQVGLGDLERYQTGDEIIKQHIDPIMHAVAYAMEQDAVLMCDDIGWFVAADGTTPTNDFVNARKTLNANFVPDAPRFAALSFAQEAVYLQQQLFLQANTSSDGGTTQRTGRIGEKYGFDVGVVPSLGVHAAGTVGGTPLAAAATLYATSLGITGGGVSGTIKKGDSFVIAGSTQRYAVTADVTLNGSGVGTVAISPSLQLATAGGEALTFHQSNNKQRNAFYHAEAFALVMAPLSDDGGKQAEIAVAVEPRSGAALRSMQWYDPATKRRYRSYDALWGKKTLDPNKAVIVES